VPTVPTTFVPQVAPQEGGDIGNFIAPGVQPMEDFTGRQLERLGQTSIQAGNVAFRIGSAMQDALDDANAKAGDVAGIRAATPLMQQYLNTSGAAAEAQYESTLNSVRSALIAPVDGMPTKTSRAMYEQVAARNLAQFEAQLTTHRLRQSKVYAANESAARADARSDMAIMAHAQRDEIDPMTGVKFGTKGYEANLQVALQEAENAARINGIADDSAQMDAVRQVVYDKVTQGVVNQYLEAKDYAGAEAFLNDMAERQAVNPKVREAMATSIGRNRERAVMDELTTSIRNSGTLSAKSDPTAYPEQEGPGKPPESIRDALEAADGIEDVEMRKLVQNNLRQQYAQEDMLAQDEYNAVLDSIEQAQASGAAVSPEMLGRLKPKDAERVLRNETIRTDAAVEYDLAVDPKLAGDQEYVRKHWSKMSLELRTKIRQLQAQPDKIIEASYDSDMLKNTLYEAGLDGLLDKSNSQDKKEFVALSNNIKTEIDFQQRMKGGKLNRAEMQDVMDRAVLVYGKGKREVPWWFDKSIDGPLATMSEQDVEVATERYVKFRNKPIPMNRIEETAKYLRENGLPNPTLREIIRYIETTAQAPAQAPTRSAAPPAAGSAFVPTYGGFGMR
jgi:hypothetical protein